MSTENIVNLEQETYISRGLWLDTARRFSRHVIGLFGLTLVAIVILMAILGRAVAPQDPNAQDFSADARFASPSIDHPMGTDDFGRDIFSRVLYGARVSVMVGVIAVGIAATSGTLLGMIAGFAERVEEPLTHVNVFGVNVSVVGWRRLFYCFVFPVIAVWDRPWAVRVIVGLAMITGWLPAVLLALAINFPDETIMRLMDVLFAFPAILLAIAILAALGKGIGNAMIAIGIVYIPIFARIARGAVLAVRGEEFITVARSIGATDVRILGVHIFPNALAPIIVEISLSLSFAILAEAALSFFGLGTQPPDPSWGRMLKEGQGYFRQSIWLGLFPGLAIMLTVMGFNFLGDGLRDALDPRMER
jgi:ABC-type dipeptide/oligopeptide/nickel transport system permease subunit